MMVREMRLQRASRIEDVADFLAFILNSHHSL
jgi:hypothetical protein